MSKAVMRILVSFPEPGFTTLRTAASSNFGVQSSMLSDVLAEESKRTLQASARQAQFAEELRVRAFLDDRLVGWSYSRAEGRDLHMINSGVDPEFRHRGIYRELVTATIQYAEEHGLLKIVSRYVPSNNDVIIPKLRLGFIISAFEYSEVYGPLIHLTHLIGSNVGSSTIRVPLRLFRRRNNRRSRRRKSREAGWGAAMRPAPLPTSDNVPLTFVITSNTESSVSKVPVGMGGVPQIMIGTWPSESPLHSFP